MGRVIADDTAVRGGVPAAGVRAYGVCLQDAGAGDGSAGCGLSSMPRGSMRPVPMAVSGARAGRLRPHGL